MAARAAERRAPTTGDATLICIELRERSVIYVYALRLTRLLPAPVLGPKLLRYTESLVPFLCVCVCDINYKQPQWRDSYRCALRVLPG